jgi:hypothetical protein
MRDTRDPPDDLALLEAVAAALRAELGDAIEQQPGFRHPGEAGQVNRAFRAVAAVLLRAGSAGSPGGGSRRACSTPARSITCSAWSSMGETTGSSI